MMYDFDERKDFLIFYNFFKEISEKIVMKRFSVFGKKRSKRFSLLIISLAVGSFKLVRTKTMRDTKEKTI